jgi:serine/threonine protein kinase
VCVCAGGSALFHIASSTGCPPLPPVLSPEAHAFLQLAFIRNPRERPTASKLLHHPFIVNPLPAHFQPAQVLTPFQVRKWSMVPISLSYITPFQTQASWGFGFQQRERREAERRHPTGRQRTGSPTLQKLQYPILLLPSVCFQRGGFPNPGANVGRGSCVPETSARLKERERERERQWSWWQPAARLATQLLYDFTHPP